MMTVPNFFDGWLGFGAAFGAGALAEPTDSAYARRAVLLGPLNSGCAQDMAPGTIGPATTNWAPLLFAGLFDAQIAGNLLAVWSLPQPVVLQAGQTWTSQGAFTLTLDGENGLSPLTSRSWLAGVQIGVIGAAIGVFAAQNLQLSGGQLAAAGTSALSNGGNLPSTAPPSGSGQLWNNGGVICIA